MFLIQRGQIFGNRAKVQREGTMALVTARRTEEHTHMQRRSDICQGRNDAPQALPPLLQSATHAQIIVY